VVINDATEAESTNATLTTLVGSIIPSLIISTYFPLAASKPRSSFVPSNNFPTIMAPSSPAF